MVTLYIPVDPDDNSPESKQNKFLLKLISEGWKYQGTTTIRKNFEDKPITVGMLEKEV